VQRTPIEVNSLGKAFEELENSAKRVRFSSDACRPEPQKDNMWDRRLQKDNAGEYTLDDDFNYLLSTTHRHPDDGFEYAVKAI
jgi:hypothetical protein